MLIIIQEATAPAKSDHGRTAAIMEVSNLFSVLVRDGPAA